MSEQEPGAATPDRWCRSARPHPEHDWTRLDSELFHCGRNGEGFTEETPGVAARNRAFYQHGAATPGTAAGLTVIEDPRAVIDKLRVMLSSLIDRTEGSSCLTDDERDEYRRDAARAVAAAAPAAPQDAGDVCVCGRPHQAEPDLEAPLRALLDQATTRLHDSHLPTEQAAANELREHGQLGAL